jgi:L-seryl-tRNA(Ser) seleniumtransferase
LALVRAEANATEPEALTELAREVLASERARLQGSRGRAVVRTPRELADAILSIAASFTDPAAAADVGLAGPVPPSVINATGVILHTNLGRAPWPRAAIEAASAAAAEYGYLELDEATGKRGRRFRAAEEHLVAVTGAEAALVVGNNAAALLLAVGLAGRRGSVAVSRGELVEIGGGVRIPEVIARAGARLIEVGTTNRTRAADFEPPLADGRANAVLRVHPSNFALTGFTETADLTDVAAIAHRHGALVIDDLGSGALLDTAVFGLAHEPTPRERLEAGADVVVFSGDKLVGGPQAGLIVGRRELIDKLRRDPLARAVRPDKSILAGVAATLGLYRAGRAQAEIPVWRMIAAPVAELKTRAERIAAALGGPSTGASASAMQATVGGGSLPGQTLPSWGVALAVAPVDSAAAELRGGPDRILARIEDGRLVCDLRTVDPSQDHIVERRLAALLAPSSASRA